MPGYGTLYSTWITCAAGVVFLIVGFRIYALGIALVYVPAMTFALFRFSFWFLGMGFGSATPMRIDVG